MWGIGTTKPPPDVLIVFAPSSHHLTAAADYGHAIVAVVWMGVNANPSVQSNNCRPSRRVPENGHDSLITLSYFAVAVIARVLLAYGRAIVAVCDGGWEKENLIRIGMFGGESRGRLQHR